MFTVNILNILNRYKSKDLSKSIKYETMKLKSLESNDINILKKYNDAFNVQSSVTFDYSSLFRLKFKNIYNDSHILNFNNRYYNMKLGTISSTCYILPDGVTDKISEFEKDNEDNGLLVDKYNYDNTYFILTNSNNFRDMFQHARNTKGCKHENATFILFYKNKGMYYFIHSWNENINIFKFAYNYYLIPTLKIIGRFIINNIIGISSSMILIILLIMLNLLYKI